MYRADLRNAYMSYLPPALRPNPLPALRHAWWDWRGMGIHLERVGDPDAPRRALLFHGAGGHAEALWPFAAATAARGFEVVVPDLPGYGRTRVPHRRTVRYSDWVHLARDLTDHEQQRDSRPVLLVGASMGGMLAYEAATGTGVGDRVVVTSLLDPRDPQVRAGVARSPWLGAVARPLLRLAVGPLANITVPIRWLVNMQAMSNDPALVALVVRDRRGGGNRMPLAFWPAFSPPAPQWPPRRSPDRRSCSLTRQPTAGRRPS